MGGKIKSCPTPKPGLEAKESQRKGCRSKVAPKKKGKHGIETIGKEWDQLDVRDNQKNRESSKKNYEGIRKNK